MVSLISQMVTLISIVLNLIVVLFCFVYKNKKDTINMERQIKLDWFKVLILDSNLVHLHGFFDKISIEMNRLKSDTEKQTPKDVNDRIIEHAATFRINFVDLLLAADKSIYDGLVELSDAMIDGFTHSIFDEGINLKHEPKFKEIVTQQLSKTKTEMIKELFKFKGEDSPKRGVITKSGV